MNTMMALGAMKMEHNGASRFAGIRAWFKSSAVRAARQDKKQLDRGVAFMAFPR